MRTTTIAAAFAAVLFLTGCGQKGDLFMPDEENDEQTATVATQNHV